MEEETKVGAMVKNSRKAKNKIYAVSVKPSAITEDETDLESLPHPKASFVAENGDSKDLTCTRDVYRRLEGNPKPNKARKSLDMRLDLDFIMHVDDKNKVVGVDTLPKMAISRSTGEEGDDGPDYVTIQVNQTTGDLDVVEVPYKLSKRDLVRILIAVDEVTSIAPGDRINKRYEVISVSGNKFQLDPVTV